MKVQNFARVAGCAAGLALLAACASGPKLSSQSESSRYRAHASRTYPAPGPASDPWGPYIREAASKYDVPERWVREVMRQESGGRLYGRNGDLITSGAGAMGLMQVMPATYDELRGRYAELGDDPFDPHNNIRAGTAYIREMYDIFGSPGFLAAYNAGPGRLDDYLTRNRRLPEETRRYVAAISPRIVGSAPASPSPGAMYASNALNPGTRYASSQPAPSSRPVIVLNPPAARPAPIQLAHAAEPSGGSYIRLQKPPSISLDPVQQASAVQSEPLPPPRALPAPVPVQVAQAPEPPRAPQFAPGTQRQLAAAALAPVQPRQSRFALVSPANAEPVGLRQSGFSPGDWAVQVGAFANRGVALSAAGAARNNARDVLSGAHTNVTSVRQSSGVLYRARLTGMSRDSASEACERLAKSRTRCMVVSPDAQS